MNWFVDALRHNPELAIFLTLALGFLVGRLKIGGFSLGTVVGTLLAGVLIGQLDIKVPAIVKTVFFDLFLFTTGYKVGPQFFRALKKDAVSQVALTVVLCVTCLVSAFVAAKLLGYDMGTAAGLLAGAFSESTVIGTAGEAINRLAIPTEEKTRLINNIPIAYAVTYLIGTAGLVWFLPVIGPKLMGINLKEEGRRAQAKTVGAAELEPGITSAARRYDVRAYRVSNQFLAKRTIGEIEAMPKDARVFILRIRRQGQIVEPQPSTVILEDDVIAVATRRAVLVEHGAKIGPEVEDHALLDIPVEMLDVVVTNRTLAGQTGAELARHEVGGGALVMGLVFGWLRSVRPLIGRIPEPAIWIFDTVGLCVFIGVVGLSAGPGFVAGLQTTGISLVVVGLVCALIPHTVAILFGRYVLRMNPLILLGACAGAGTITAALRAIQDEAQSKVPALGYTVPYAIGNILLTAWGPVIVALMWAGR